MDKSAPGTISTPGAVAERSPLSGSAVGEVTVAVFVVTVPRAACGTATTSSINVAVAPGAILAALQVIVPFRYS